MHCCSALQNTFDRRTAARDLRRLERRGPLASTRKLVDALHRAGAEGSLLDIGGGVGAVSLEMLRNGVRDVVSVDASAAYTEAARDLARRRGVADLVERHVGDFVELADTIDCADVVTLDRVICCYPAWRRLVALSAARARHLYGVVVPRNRWSVRLMIAAGNLFFFLTRNPFRVFVHPPDTVSSAIEDHGFRRVAAQRTFVWQVLVFERIDPSPAPG